MTADEELLSSSLGRLGDGELNYAELDRRVIKFQGALRRLRADPAEAARIDVLVTATEFGEDPRPQAKALAATNIALMGATSRRGRSTGRERLVDHYARLIWGITNEFRLVESDGADVAQTTWLRLLQHIDRIENPERVGEWLAATARNECLRVLAAPGRSCLTRTRPSPMVLPHTSIRPMYSFWLTSEPKRFVTPFPCLPR